MLCVNIFMGVIAIVLNIVDDGGGDDGEDEDDDNGGDGGDDDEDEDDNDDEDEEEDDVDLQLVLLHPGSDHHQLLHKAQYVRPGHDNVTLTLHFYILSHFY